MMVNTLVFGTCYVATEEKMDMFRAWLQCMRRQNGVDLLVVDSASPFAREIRLELKDDEYVSFNDNIGHLAVHGRDGWGRAFCKGIEIAIEDGYKYAVHIETDLIFRPSVNIMLMQSKPVVSVKANPYGHLETAIMSMDTAFMADIDFITRYDWASKTKDDYPEHIVEQIIGPDNIYYMDSIKGCRDDAKKITDASNLDYITHCYPAARESFMGSLCTSLQA